MFEYEEKYKSQGARFIAGMDEAGRGPLAGPVVVAAVVMPLSEDKIIPGINDSKKLSEKKREALYEKIRETALDFRIAIIEHDVIDQVNILNATKMGMKECVEGLKQVDVVLIDAVKLDLPVKNESIIHGDALSYSIAAASILAKVTRDRLMYVLHTNYPEYNFAQNKGYGTAEHIKMLKKYGPCPVHRKTFIGHFVEV